MILDLSSIDVLVSVDNVPCGEELIDLKERVELLSDLAENQNLLIESRDTLTYIKLAKELRLLRKKNNSLQNKITLLGSNIAKVAEANLEAFDKLSQNERSNLRNELEQLTRSLKGLRIY